MYSKSNKINFEFENVNHICFGEKTRNEFSKVTEELEIPKGNVHVCQTCTIDEILMLLNNLKKNE